jgi:hypothetical protein
MDQVASVGLEQNRRRRAGAGDDPADVPGRRGGSGQHDGDERPGDARHFFLLFVVNPVR